MMEARILKTEEEYKGALAEIDRLMDSDSQQDLDRLELFSVLVENYENVHFPMPCPDPIAAIRFRMEQQGLTRKDLGKYIGSASKVSEVLAGKRPLSLSMIRDLHDGLGIPAEVLLQEPRSTVPEKKYDFAQYPFTEMFNRGYFPGFNGTLSTAKDYAEELLSSLFEVMENQRSAPVYCKRGKQSVNEYALSAWQARAISLAKEESLPPFTRSRLEPRIPAELVKLSYYSDGPRLAKEYLGKKGIHLVVLAHLSKTYLDGACFYAPGGRPIIGMTLRMDRLDNFWFTLLHEVAHLFLHLDDSAVSFFDDTENGCLEATDTREEEANTFATEALVPKAAWEQYKSKLLTARNASVILDVAEELECAPAIIAGRIRWEKRDFTLHSELVGSKAVRKCFPNLTENK